MHSISTKINVYQHMSSMNCLYELPVEIFLQIIKHVSLEEMQHCLMTSKQILKLEDKTYTYFAHAFGFTIQAGASTKTCFLLAEKQCLTKFNKVEAGSKNCAYLKIFSQNAKQLNYFERNCLLQKS